MQGEDDEPLTPAGRLFLQPEMNQIIHCVIGLKKPIDVDSVKTQIQNSVMLQHPRFTSLMVRDHRGVEHWRPIKIDLDRHIFIINNESVSEDKDDESAISEYMSDLCTESKLSMDKPLWEMHILRAHKCIIFRIHHSLGDGISLMSMLLAGCRKLQDPNSLPTISLPNNNNKSQRRNLWSILIALYFSFIYVIQFILRVLWIRDRKTAITGGEGVDLWPRKIATATFSLEHMKTVKNAVPNATINDVLFAVISSGISRYLDFREPNGLQDGVQLTGLAMVNLRKQPGLQELSNLMKSNSGAKWGNKFGLFLLPIYYHRSNSSDPLEYLKRAKVMIDRKKRSLEAHLSYKIGDLVMSTLGPKFASLLNYRILCNTTFTISNVVGPQEEIMIGGNPITFLRANNSALPHALVLNMVSYAGKADMQVQVAKDIIPDPEFLAKCFEDALLEMKEQVTTKI
ncbi:O-acyltransferase WSD1 isoform X2 [Medicago truncatula]|uniref:O-acyltransferase WSD1 isoform X2 n=1 Tax=Medicago truncatula TaxID=3880 RepID=UPI001967914A|nr:O-acyltransferase WSD1-like isoform X2 [Medicago truncatula]